MAGSRGGQSVSVGYYLKLATFELTSVVGERGILPGSKQTRYIRVPLPLLMVAGPLNGLAYVISLPVAVCLAFGYSLTRRISRMLRIVKRNYHLGMILLLHFLLKK